MIKETSIDFLGNIENSRKLIASKGRTYSDYWLNSDGTVTSKRSWLARVVRWIQNLCFNKTICDTWSIFQKTVEILEKQRSSMQEKGKLALRFIVKFFRELKPELNRQLKTDPKKVEFLESGLRTECGDAIEEALLTVYAESRSVNPEMLKRVPTQEKTSLMTADIGALGNVYDQIPLTDSSVKSLMTKVASGEFWKTLLESKNYFLSENQIKEKKTLGKEALPETSQEKLWGHTQLSDFFSSVKLFLAEQIEVKEGEDLGLSTAEYIEMILNKTLATLDPNRTLLQLYQASKQRDQFHWFIGRVKARDPTVPGATKQNLESYYDQIQFHLSCILNALPQPKKFTQKIFHKHPEPKVKRENIYAALKELADASELCFAAWVWECGEQCRLLQIDCLQNNSFQEIEQHLLRESHRLKESLIMESVDKKTAIHCLNGFKCSEEGKSLGFSDEFAIKDPYRAELNSQQKILLKNHVIAKYPKTILRYVTRFFPQFGFSKKPTLPEGMRFLEKQQILLF